MSAAALPGAVSVFAASPAPFGTPTATVKGTFAVLGFGRDRTPGDDGGREKVYRRPVAWEVVRAEGGPVLRGVSGGIASMLYRDVAYDAREYPRLRWEWKVLRLPRMGTDNTRANDDYGARVYIFFPGRTFLSSRVLEYVRDNGDPVGTIKSSPSSGKCKLIVVSSGPGDLGKWVAVERNLLDDFKEAFGRPPDRPVGGIGFMTDSDNTSSSAEALYYDPVTIAR